MTKQYFDILDEQLVRCETMKISAEHSGRQAHAILLDRIAQAVRDEVYAYKLDMPYTTAPTTTMQGRVAQHDLMLDSIETALATLPPLDVYEDDEEDMEEDEDDEEDEDETDRLIRKAPKD